MPPHIQTKKPIANVDIVVPANARPQIAPKLDRKGLVRSEYPPSKMMGGRRRKKNTLSSKSSQSVISSDTDDPLIIRPTSTPSRIVAPASCIQWMFRCLIPSPMTNAVASVKSCSRNAAFCSAKARSASSWSSAWVSSAMDILRVFGVDSSDRFLALNPKPLHSETLRRPPFTTEADTERTSRPLNTRQRLSARKRAFFQRHPGKSRLSEQTDILELANRHSAETPSRSLTFLPESQSKFQRSHSL